MYLENFINVGQKMLLFSKNNSSDVLHQLLKFDLRVIPTDTTSVISLQMCKSNIFNGIPAASSSSALQLFVSFGLLNYFFPFLPLLRRLFPIIHSHLP